MATYGENNFDYQRKHVRFKPDPLAAAYISFTSNSKDKIFKPDLVALIVEEAPLGGCGLVVLKDKRLNIGLECVLKVGKLAPLKAHLVWIKELDEDLIRLGFKFLE